MRLTADRWADLKEFNRAVNQSIIPERNELGLAGEIWLNQSGPRRLQRLCGKQANFSIAVGLRESCF